MGNYLHTARTSPPDHEKWETDIQHELQEFYRLQLPLGYLPCVHNTYRCDRSRTRSRCVASPTKQRNQQLSTTYPSILLGEVSKQTLVNHALLQASHRPLNTNHLRPLEIGPFDGDHTNWPYWKVATIRLFEVAGYQEILYDKQYAQDNPAINQMLYNQLREAVPHEHIGHLSQIPMINDGQAVWETLCLRYDKDNDEAPLSHYFDLITKNYHFWKLMGIPHVTFDEAKVFLLDEMTHPSIKRPLSTTAPEAPETKRLSKKQRLTDCRDADRSAAQTGSLPPIIYPNLQGIITVTPLSIWHSLNSNHRSWVLRYNKAVRTNKLTPPPPPGTIVSCYKDDGDGNHDISGSKHSRARALPSSMDHYSSASI